MLPRGHVLLGTIFTLIFWIVLPETGLLFLALVFLSSFLIDFDHYAASVLKMRELSLKRSFVYHKVMQRAEEKERARGIRRRGDFHLFHTIEFHIAILGLGYLWVGFFYIFAGMVFHSLVDLIYLIRLDRLYRREYIFIAWLWRKLRS